MKKMFRMVALVAIVSGLAFAGCDKDDNSNSNTGSGTVDSTTQPTPPPTPEPEPEPETWVDLGLPSGLLWASCNIGANTPAEYGDYYAWGETETKSSYGYDTYVYCNGSSYNLTKYCNNSIYGDNGFIDDMTTLEAMDDVATQELGDGARMPTNEDWREIVDNTTSSWTTMNGVYGRRLTSKTNGQSIFLPAAGNMAGSELYYAGEDGFYWSSSLCADSPDKARYFHPSHEGQFMSDTYRALGIPVRAVRQN